MYTRPIIALIVSCLFTAPVSAGTIYRPGDWISYSIFRYVNAIATDNRYVYFATTGGISRYNLYSDTWADPLTTSDGLADNRVAVVAIDPAFNELWCATRGGVSRYNDRVQTWTTYRSGGGLFLDDVHSIGVTDDGYLIFETQGGTAEFDTHRQIWQAANRSGGMSTRRSSFIRWYGARGRGAYTYPVFIPDFDYNFNPPEWIQDRSFQTYPLTAFLEDTFANVWVGTWGLNIGKASLRSLRLTMLRTGLVSRNVTAMSFDGKDIWFGGQEGFRDLGGITRYNRETKGWTYFQPNDTDGLYSGTITAITVDTTAVWFGTDNGLVWYDKRSDLWTTLPIRNLTSPRVTALALSGHTLWIGSTAGINRMDRYTRAIEPVQVPALRDLRIYDIAVDMYQDVWIATNRGVYRWRAEKGWKKIEDPSSGNLNGPVFVIDMDGESIWFGTSSSLLEFTRTDGRWRQWLLPISVSGGRFRMNVTDTLVWLGTRSGAVKFDKARETWKIYTRRDGLLDETVQSLLLDGDYIWFGTREGVTRFYWNDPTRGDQ